MVVHVKQALEDQRVLCCGLLRKLRGMTFVLPTDCNIAEEAARRLDVTIDETLAALSAEPDICTCPDWTPGIKKVVTGRNPCPPFRFCPWCGGRAPK